MLLIDAIPLLDIFKQNSITDMITIGDKTIRQHVYDAPTIDAVPVVHASWFYDDEDDRKNVECSHCHMRWAVVSDDPDSDYLVLHMTADELLFCPSCGARMDGEPNDDSR